VSALSPGSGVQLVAVTEKVRQNRPSKNVLSFIEMFLNTLIEDSGIS
jgi:hypothetical protein